MIGDDVAPPIAPGAWPADLVERRRVETLIPYARNARTHSDEQVAQIAASIREWGWTVPVLVDEDNVLIAGHGRILAAERLGLAEAPTTVARGWTDAQKRAYRIARNKLALNAGWDNQLLSLERGELRDDPALVGTIGFSDEEIAKLLAQTGPPDEFASYDETVPTEHQCPRCGYRWSGKADTAEAETNGENLG